MDLYKQSLKVGENFLLTRYVVRPLAYPVALLFRRLGLGANTVTVLGGLAWITSAFTVMAAGLLLAGHPAQARLALVVTALLWCLGLLLDVADGSLARMTSTSSAAGFYLDYCFHLIFQPVFLSSIGVALYLATSGSVYLALWVPAVFCNWGVSYGAKEHVLCESVALGKCDPSSMTDQERYRLFIDSPATKSSVSDKRTPTGLLLNLFKELTGFPGQFILFAAAAIADAVLIGGKLPPLFLTGLTFVFVTVIMTLRVPFRLHREFRLLRSFRDTLENKPRQR